MSIVLPILIGIVVGIVSGLIGIGGGVLVVPILTFVYHMSQPKAQGTSLAILLPPVGFLAFWQYYKAGAADLKLGLLIALGIFVGGFFGGDLAQHLSEPVLKKIFAIFMFGIALKLFLEK
jgi:uncharacterized protein